MAHTGTYQRLWLGYEPNRWGKSLCDWVEGKALPLEGQPCKPGQSAARTGCTPKPKGGAKGKPAKKPESEKKPPKPSKEAAPKAKNEEGLKDKPKSGEIVRGTDKRGRDYCRQGGKPVKCPAKEEEKKPEAVVEPEKPAPEPAPEVPEVSESVAEPMVAPEAAPESAASEPIPEPMETPAAKPIDLNQIDPNHPMAKAVAADLESHAVLEAMRDWSETSGHRASAENLERLQREYEKARDAVRAAEDASPPASEEELRQLRSKRADATVAAFVAKREHDAEFSEKARKALIDAMGVKDPTTITTKDHKGVHLLGLPLVSARPLEEEQRAPMEAGKDFVTSITKGPPINVTVGQSSDGRAYYNPLSRSLMLGPTAYELEPTMVHELGHAIEHNKPGVFKKAVDFVNYRCGDEKEKDLSKVDGGEGMKGEKGRKNHFDRSMDELSAYYVGKLYHRPSLLGLIPIAGIAFNLAGAKGPVMATELVSMGVEQLYRDPAHFMAKDPEYAQFIVGILRS